MDDSRNAFKCLLTAAQSGDTWGQVNLGSSYASGTGVRRSLRKAAYWYKKAYNNGNSWGSLNLAIDRTNQGRIRSAVIWFKKAAEMNDGAAFLELAKIYKARKGGKKAAASLLRRALRMGRDDISYDAREEVESLLKEITKLQEHSGTRSPRTKLFATTADGLTPVLCTSTYESRLV